MLPIAALVLETLIGDEDVQLISWGSSIVITVSEKRKIDLIIRHFLIVKTHLYNSILYTY